jgi:Leucine-rich repeat (LRR) protein
MFQREELRVESSAGTPGHQAGQTAIVQVEKEGNMSQEGGGLYQSLRSILSEPSYENWRSILSLLQSLSGAEQDLAAGYVRVHTAHWPDEIKWIAAPWAEETLQLPPESYIHKVYTSLQFSAQSAEEIFTLAESSLLTHYRKLDLSTSSWRKLEKSEEAVVQLMNSPFSGELTELKLGIGPMSIESLRAFLASSSVPNLTSLHIHCGGDEGAMVLASSRRLKRLQTLDLTGDELTDRGLQFLARSENLQQLKSLELCGNLITGSSFSQEEHYPLFEQLRELSLYANDLSEKGVSNLAALSSLRNLEKLILGQNRLSRQAVEAVASSPIFRKLKFLDLSYIEIQNEGIAAISSSPHLKNLESLDLSNCSITDQDVETIANSSVLRQLKNLKLWENRISAVGEKALSQMPCLKNLEVSWESF